MKDKIVILLIHAGYAGAGGACAYLAANLTGIVPADYALLAGAVLSAAVRFFRARAGA